MALFAISAGPWYLRQLAVFGSLSPSTASGKVLFIRNIGEWNSITIPANLNHLLGMGIGPLLLTRLGGLVAAAFIFTVLIGVFVLVPFMVIGACDGDGVTRHSGRSWATPSCCSRSARSCPPSMCPAAPSSTPRSRWRRTATCSPSRGSWARWAGSLPAGAAGTWRPRPACSSRAAVAFAVLAAVAGAVSAHTAWDTKRQTMQAVGAALDAAGAPVADRLMSIDASGYRYWTGHPGVVLVNDPLDTVEAVARAYDIRWLVLEKGDTVPAAAAILVDGQRPAWVGPPILARSDVSVYPVCTTTC